MKRIKYIPWFTVVELIVIISILTVLWAMSYMSFMWYSKWARDAIRVTNIDLIYNSLRSVKVTMGRYPIPDDYKEIRYEWKLLWRHWIIWDNVSDYIQSSLFIDPKYRKKTKIIFFSYWVLGDNTDFQIGTIIEDIKNKPLN